MKTWVGRPCSAFCFDRLVLVRLLLYRMFHVSIPKLPLQICDQAISIPFSSQFIAAECLNECGVICLFSISGLKWRLQIFRIFSSVILAPLYPGNKTCIGACNQIALPMSRHSAIIGFGRPFTDRDGVLAYPSFAWHSGSGVSPAFDAGTG